MSNNDVSVWFSLSLQCAKCKKVQVETVGEKDIAAKLYEESCGCCYSHRGENDSLFSWKGDARDWLWRNKFFEWKRVGENILCSSCGKQCKELFERKVYSYDNAFKEFMGDPKDVPEPDNLA